MQFALSYMDYDYNEYMLMGFDNDIDGDWENGLFRDNFRGVWASLNGNYCASHPHRRNGDLQRLYHPHSPQRPEDQPAGQLYLG